MSVFAKRGFQQQIGIKVLMEWTYCCMTIGMQNWYTHQGKNSKLYLYHTGISAILLSQCRNLLNPCMYFVYCPTRGYNCINLYTQVWRQQKRYCRSVTEGTFSGRVLAYSTSLFRLGLGRDKQSLIILLVHVERSRAGSIHYAPCG